MALSELPPSQHARIARHCFVAIRPSRERHLRAPLLQVWRCLAFPFVYCVLLARYEAAKSPGDDTSTVMRSGASSMLSTSVEESTTAAAPTSSGVGSMLAASTSVDESTTAAAPTSTPVTDVTMETNRCYPLPVQACWNNSSHESCSLSLSSA
eukprot:349155-Amphidinium_carterae.1